MSPGRPIYLICCERRSIEEVSGEGSTDAAAVERDPSFAARVAMVYSMGGAIDVEGNAPEGRAEWNYFVDPTAVDMVISSGLPFTMVPLDATNRVPMTREWFDALRRHHATPAAGAVLSMQDAAEPFNGGFFFWDELAAAVAADEAVTTIETRTVAGDTDGPTAGTTRLSADGRAIRVAIDVDRLRLVAAAAAVHRIDTAFDRYAEKLRAADLQVSGQDPEGRNRCRSRAAGHDSASGVEILTGGGCGCHHHATPARALADTRQVVLTLVHGSDHGVHRR